jgi:LPS-assembly lipoprotein
MSSFNRRSLLLMPLALMACGFTPAYGPNGPAAGLQGSVSVASPADKNSFDLVERLEERLGRPKAVAYDMTYAINTSVAAVGITPENATTRYNLNGSIDWTLVARATGQRVTGGRVHGVTAYSATGSTVAGLSAQDDAARRLMRLLADQIVSRMLASSGLWAQ